MKILFLTTRLPYPLDGGAKIRTWNLFSFVAGRHDVTLLTFLHSEPDRLWVPTVQSLAPTARIETVDHPDSRSRIARWGSMPARLLSELPYTVVKYYSETMSRRLEDLLEAGSFDLIHCDQIHMAQYLIGRASPPVVLNVHNIDSSLLERVAEVQRNPVVRRFFHLQQRKMQMYERGVFKAFDHVLTVSSKDQELLDTLVPNVVSSVVTNGVDTKYFYPEPPLSGSSMLTFTGAMDWMPNVDGVLFFIKEIFPRVRKAVPAARFIVVGRNPPARLLRAAEREPGVMVTGGVPDVRPWLAQSSVVVVPLRSGGGTRLKILEAMAMGKAVISTRVGAEGLDLEDGREICIADDPLKFAERTIELLTDHSEAKRLGQVARRRVVEHYDWKVAGESMLAVYDRVMESKRGFSENHRVVSENIHDKEPSGRVGPHRIRSESEEAGRESSPRGMRTLLICHDDAPLDQVVLARWLAHVSDLAGMVVIKEPRQVLRRRVIREIKRVGLLRFCDTLAFRFYYQLFLSKQDCRWMEEKVKELSGRYPELNPQLPVLVVERPNSPEAEAFIKKYAPDIMIARCKNILKESIFSIPSKGTFVMHPGVCPEYRNAHGCFWALANDDLTKVGMTLLKIDKGIDSGPVYGYYSYDYDEVNESHFVIQNRVVLENLDAIRDKLYEIGRGAAKPIDVKGRPSNTWGQPWFTRYLQWKYKARRRMS